MSSRLKKILSKLISENHNGFTLGKETMDNIVLVMEVLHSMVKEKVKGMAIKLDVSKAYDRVIWNFLIHVLRKFGFDYNWIDCVKFCISIVSFSLLVNGSVCGFFEATNGLRQGDPLFPFLFVLVAEVLSNNIKNRSRMGLWRGIRVHPQIEPITYSQFVDDTLFFGVASMEEVIAIKDTLDEYATASGHFMNKEKSHIYFLNTSK
ncbi:secreted RxLR effector protein 78-like [Cryptomeria japonica]|uniref:secreted RxLR effector protein 78-like n=1 Tax=Cryptomeria japonica TaxID=3369 RepID=UPI0027D9ECCA|nr:secreted RxLR effector protein 78-like [Cryptomeria japonica]